MSAPALRRRPGGPSPARLALVPLLALLWLVALALPASAHAVLVESLPADRTAVDTVPETVVLRFNEPVHAPADGIRVFDASATRVDDGPSPTAATSEVAVALPADLPDGGYVVVYRVISDDSHPVAGTFTFTVGEGDPVDEAVIADLFGGAGQAWTGTVGPILRGLSYIGVLLAAGAVAFSAWVAGAPRERRVATTWVIRGAVLGAVASLLAVPVQAVAVTGRDLVGVFGPGGGLGETLVASSFGHSTLVRLVALAALAVAALRLGDAPAGGTRVHLAALATGTLATASYLLDGHQRAVQPTWLLTGADLVHLLGAAIWLGGLVLLFLTVRSRRLDDDPVGAAGLVSRFSRLAFWSVIALAVAGSAMSVVLVRAPRALVTTGYGWTLLAKVALVGIVLLAAAYNRWRLEPAIAARLAPAGGSVDVGSSDTDRREARSRRAWGQLRTTLAVEVVGVLVVALLTGFLVSQRPAAEAAGITGMFQTTVSLTEEYDVDLVVDPNEVGLNAVHVYVLDQAGQPVDDVEELRFELTYVPQQIGPIEVEPFLVGPGHWTANIEDLRFPGEWEVRVVAGIDRFTQADVTIPVVVNRR